MKKLLYRKLFFDYMSFFFIALITSSLIIWIFQAVNFLDIMIEDGREYKVYINYSLLNFPKILSKLLPFVLFFSIYFILSRYETNNELIIFWNFGESKIKFINFIIKISFLLFLLQILLTSLVVPKSQDQARSFLRNSNIDFLGNFIKPKRFNDTLKGVTIYSEKKDENGVMYNLYIKKNIRDGFELTYAKKGVFEKKNTIPILILYEGETIRSKDSKITNFNFSKSDFLISNLDANTITQQKTQEMNTMDLVSCITELYELKVNSYFKESKNKIINCRDGNKLNLLKEFYKRLIVPLYIPLLMLIPYILVLSSKEKNNYIRLKLITFLTGVGIIIFSEGIIRFVSKELLSNLYIFIAPCIILLFFYSIFIYKLNFKSIKDESIY